MREEFRARLREELRGALGLPPPVPEVRRRYRQAACLLASFDPVLLRLPGEAAPTGRAAVELAADCTVAGTGDADTEWSLVPEVREEALRSFAGPGEALRALEGNAGAVRGGPGPESACLSLLRGDAAAPAGADATADLLQAVRWLSLVPGVEGLPDPAAVRRELELARLLEPLERLVRVPFVGRERELAELRRYATDPQAAAPGRGPAPPLLVHGAGGMGKSTLLAHFVLDALAPVGARRGDGGDGAGGTGDAGRGGPPGTGSAERARFGAGGTAGPGHEPPGRGGAEHEPPGPVGAGALRAGGRTFPFPFAYVDFERPSLSVHEPVTLVAETARQLAVQFPAFQEELESLAEEGLRLLGSHRAREERVAGLSRLAATRGPGRQSSREFLAEAGEQDCALFRRVARVLRHAVTPRHPPFVLVIDSFEEAQYRWSPEVGRMWALYFAFHDAYPGVRVVVSGRAPVGHPGAGSAPLEVELRDLDADASVAVLRAYGVADEELARLLAERVGGHPLSLRLAARAAVLAGGGGAGLRELVESLPERRRDFFRQVDQLLVQGLLYERILGHIPDEDVRRLAHAGLVLRQITPDVVREVLAGPCGVTVSGPAEARRLFGALSRLDLVESAGPQAVRVRPDVRSIMLRLARSDPGSVAQEVERRAVAYYAARDGLVDRAEEIYHRLRLGEHPRTVEERWLPGVERLLAGAQDEVGPRSAALLTAHSRRQRASVLVMAEAEQEDWERIAAHEVEDLLAQGFTAEALARLEERRPWTLCGPLHVLLAESLIRAGRRADARRVVSEAVEGTQDAGCGERRLELLLLSARLAQEEGDAEGADRELRLAEDVAIGLGQHLEAMGTLLARSRLADGRRERGTEEELVRRLRGVPDAVLAEQPALVREVAAQVYPLDERALDHALALVGLPEDDQALEVLGGALQRAVRRDGRLLPPLMALLHQAAGPGGGRSLRARSAAGSRQGQHTGYPLVQGPSARHPHEQGQGPRGPGGGGQPPSERPDRQDGQGLRGQEQSERPGHRAQRQAQQAQRPRQGGGGQRETAGAASPSDAAPDAGAASASDAASTSGVADILRLARDRGALDALARRLLVLRDEGGDIAAGVAAALRTGTVSAGSPERVAPGRRADASGPSVPGPGAEGGTS
ncbi:hypothetical protein BJP40_09595 [Streptomyces sp. CC53]|nr:hypothetical protein BJP40_09595 [Streptomyces sp. CC53]